LGYDVTIYAFFTIFPINGTFPPFPLSKVLEGVIPMKRIIVGIVIAGTVLGSVTSGYASDWDKAGKALAIIEGARILTGGNLDIIGNITGIGRDGLFSPYRRSRRPSRIWVPHYIWRKKLVPEHEEYHQEYGTIVVEEHYIRYRAESGGHWE